MLLYRLGPRVSIVVRLIILALVSWSVASSGDGVGFSGRSLVITVLLAIGIAAWLVWTLHPTAGPVFGSVPTTPRTVLGGLVSASERTFMAAVYTLAAVGGILIAADPASASSAFVFAAVLAAGARLEAVKAAPVPALGCLSLAVGVLIYDRPGLTLLAYALSFAVALLASSNVRQTIVRAEQAELLLAQTQRSREEQLRSARLEESTRIAREIHDVLAHSLAGLTIQLEATRALLEQGVERELLAGRLDQALTLAREGLHETRRAVGVLRGEAVAVPVSLEEMLADYRSAEGTPASIAIEGDRSRLVGPVGLAVLRVTQEALTNVRKHAPGAEVSVLLRAGSEPQEELVLVVSDRLSSGASGLPADNGAERRELAASGGGYGLRGMRERAEILGGTLSAGPVENGWRVELRLPAGATDEASSGELAEVRGPAPDTQLRAWRTRLFRGARA